MAFLAITEGRRRASRGEGIIIAIRRVEDDVIVGVAELDVFADTPDEAEVSFAALEAERDKDIWVAP